VHGAASFCVFLLGRRLWPERPWLAFCAGLLFLCFGGHSEAVTWIGGMADPLVTLFTLSALLLHLQALESSRPRLLIASSWALFALALLSKESAVIYPVLLVLCLAVLAPHVLRRRALAASWLIVPGLLIGLFVVLRHHAVGLWSVTLAGLATNTDPITVTRAFALRTVLPLGRLLDAVFRHRLDVFVLGPLMLGAVAIGGPAQRRALLLTILGCACVLGPVLPLTISLDTTESERFVYMATAFSCLFVAAWLDVALRSRRLLVAAALAVFCVSHAAALHRSNRNWIDAARIVEGTLRTLGDIVREHGRPGVPVVVANVPDNIGGAYIFRRGFHESLRLTSPDRLAALAVTPVLSVYRIGAPPVDASVTVSGSREMTVNTGGTLLGVPEPDTPFVALRSWSGQSFMARFTPAADGSLVVYFTPWEAALVGRLPFDSGQYASVASTGSDASAPAAPSPPPSRFAQPPGGLFGPAVSIRQGRHHQSASGSGTPVWIGVWASRNSQQIAPTK
jgi:hypothetical protein